MTSPSPTGSEPKPARKVSPWVWGTAGVGAALLVIDHWAHVLGVLPYLVLLACPLMHLLHRGHRH